MKVGTKKSTKQWLTLLFGLIVILSPSLFSQVRWERTNGPYGGTVRALAVDDNLGIIYASTYGNGVFRSVDQATNWQPANTDLDGVVVRSLSVDPSSGVLYAGTDGWGILRSNDQGTSWDRSTSPEFAYLSVQAILVFPGGLLFAGTTNGIYRSIDDGITWVPMNAGLANLYVYSLTLTHSGIIIAGTNGGAFRSGDYGESWFPSGNTLGGKSCYSIVVHPTNDVAYLGASDGVYQSLDNGATWIPTGLMESGLSVFALSIDAVDGTIYAGSDLDGVYKSVDGGGTWNPVSTDIPSHSTRSLAVDHSGAVFAGFLGCGVYRSTNNGTSWTEQNTGLTGTDIYTLRYHPIGGLFAGTPSNGLYHTTDNGRNWLHIGNEIRTLTIFSIFVHPNRTMFAATRNGVYRSSDNGDTWTLSSNGLSMNGNPMYDIIMNATGDMFAFNLDGIYRSVDTGYTWTPISSSLPLGGIYSLTVSPTGTLFTIIDTLGVYRSTNNGTTWNHVGAGITTKNLWTVLSIPLTAPSLAILTGTDVGIFRSTNNGDTWNHVMSGQDINVFDVGPRGLVFCGTSTDGVYVSDDNGISWYQTNQDLTSSYIVSFGFSPNGLIFAGGNGSGVWRGIPTFPMISTPQKVQFQNVSVGRPENQIITIGNVGGDPLRIDSIRIAGTNRNDFSVTNTASTILLQQDETITLTIQFAPTGAGIREANLFIYSNDPSLEIATIPLHGIGVQGPQIAVDDTLSFGAIGIGTSADQDLTIQNIGSGNLRIDSMHIQMTTGVASEFQFVNVLYPITITGGTTQRVTLRWSPGSAGPRNGVLILYSNDPTRSAAQVIVVGTALQVPVIAVPDTISFGNIPTGLSSDQTLAIQNTGSGSLRIDSIRIQATAGVSSEFKIVGVTYPLLVGGGITQPVTVRWTPKSDGAKNAMLAIYSNDLVRPMVQVFARGTAVTDNAAPVISNVSVPTLRSPGNPITITAEVSDVSGVQDFYFLYRTGKGAWQRVDFNRGTAPPSGSIPEAAVTTDGIDYCIVASDPSGNTTVMNGISAGQFSPIVIAAAADRFSYSPHAGTQQTDYRLFSIPVILATQQVSNFFSGKNSLGSTGTEWRLFRYVNPSGYEEWSMTNDFNFQDGHAYMLITSKNVTISNTVGGIASLGYLRVPGFKLEAGWNFIGAFFPYQIALSDLELVPPVNDLPTNAFYYTGTGSQSGWEFGSAAGFKPWEGLAIRVNDTCLLKLKIAAAGTPKTITPGSEHASSVDAYFRSTEDAQNHTDENEREWVGQIIASDKVSFDKITYFGVHTNITTTDGALVVYEPPAMPNTVSLFFPNPKSSAVSDRLAADIRPSVESGATWDLELHAAPHTMVRFEIKNLTRIPARLGVFLYDPARNALYDMRQRAFQEIYSTEGSRSLQLIVGERSYVTQAAHGLNAIPAEYALAQNYPNPFNPVTLIRYQIPEQGYVTLIVYSITGQEVIRLVDSEQSAGYYDVMVDATGLASGVYFYRLNVNGTSMTKKLAVVR